MAFLNEVLDPPSYGYERNGQFYVPSRREIFREFLSRLNLFKSKKNWLSFWGWFSTLSLSVPFLVFFIYFFSWPLLAIGLVYSMVVMGTYGTIFHHRYGTHHAYVFRNRFWLFLCRNLVIKLVPEETYIVSHHVHHQLTEKPGDPYNVHGGWLYCFLADANHQPIAKDLSRANYELAANMVRHTGVVINSYEQYLKWGSICHPLRTILHYALNWAFWYAAFYLIGGHALAIALFGLSIVWGIGVRTFNYDGHGGGKDKRTDGIDFNREDLSINQVWPGYVAGEWHNNHHLYPHGARSGFLPYQLDLAWVFIRFYSFIGGISSYRDFKSEFYRDHYLPFLAAKRLTKTPEASRNRFLSKELTDVRGH